MKRYQCHKVVEAAKITEVQKTRYGHAIVHLQDFGEAGIVKDESWMEKHQPQVGGYLVRYGDGYESFSPAHVFEEGYKLLTEPS